MLPARNQVFKHKSLRETFFIQTDNGWFFSYAYFIFKWSLKKINQQCWYGWYSHFLAFYHSLSLSLELIYLLSGLEIQEPVKFQLGPVLRVLHAGIQGSLVIRHARPASLRLCDSSFLLLIWISIYPGPCSQLISANAMTWHVLGVFGKLARHFSSFKKTCSETLNLNDQNLDFEGHTFFHKKFGNFTLFDSLILLHPSCLITTRVAPVLSRLHLGHTLVLCSNQDFAVATGVCFAGLAAFLYLERSLKGSTKAYDHLCVCVVPYEDFVWAQ